MHIKRGSISGKPSIYKEESLVMFRTVDSVHLNPNNFSGDGLRPCLGRPGWSRFWADRGTFLLETVVASMIFAMVGVAVLSSLDTVN